MHLQKTFLVSLLFIWSIQTNTLYSTKENFVGKTVYRESAGEEKCKFSFERIFVFGFFFLHVLHFGVRIKMSRLVSQQERKHFELQTTKLNKANYWFKDYF